MNRTSSLLAALALGAAGVAFAQGNPPTTAPANPATAAGQQSPAGGAMGTTGTTPQNTSPSGSTSSGSTSSGSMSSGPSSSSSGSTMAQGSQGNMGSGSTMGTEQPMRQARADRN
ncbi:cobalamin biosynthesis Mg chelatase CobN [Variovorax boronicumulans]|uniref:proteophosphoglycan ppg4 n=1 Tax=Variovorax boronicumulans TaxID=436515 RepID=UPI002780F6E3|nr:proteophosphoglycan ppg4 [Variovorax boronicumulans]MDQ0070364.1 cobalamin biosynthesis Mg chelatase CobN [Variovorax boronicumulans]